MNEIMLKLKMGANSKVLKIGKCHTTQRMEIL